MKRFLAVALLLVLVIFSTGAGVSATTVTIYNDFTTDFNKAAWSAAVGSYKTETFADKVLEPEITYTTVKGAVSPQGYWHDTLNSWSSNPSETTWFFSPQMYGLGGNWTLGGPGGSGNYLKVTVEELGFTGYISSKYNGNFWGIVADKPFTKVKLTGGTATNQQIYFLDDMVYGPVTAPMQLTFLRAGAQVAATPLRAGAQVAATPLPGAIWLLGGGLLLLVGLRKLS